MDSNIQILRKNHAELIKLINSMEVDIDDFEHQKFMSSTPVNIRRKLTTIKKLCKDIGQIALQGKKNAYKGNKNINITKTIQN
jgi:hypothetical protein